MCKDGQPIHLLLFRIAAARAQPFRCPRAFHIHCVAICINRRMGGATQVFRIRCYQFESARRMHTFDVTDKVRLY